MGHKKAKTSIQTKHKVIIMVIIKIKMFNIPNQKLRKSIILFCDFFSCDFFPTFIFIVYPACIPDFVFNLKCVFNQILSSSQGVAVHQRLANTNTPQTVVIKMPQGVKGEVLTRVL